MNLEVVECTLNSVGDEPQGGNAIVLRRVLADTMRTLIVGLQAKVSQSGTHLALLIPDQTSLVRADERVFYVGKKESNKPLSELFFRRQEPRQNSQQGKALLQDATSIVEPDGLTKAIRAFLTSAQNEEGKGLYFITVSKELFTRCIQKAGEEQSISPGDLVLEQLQSIYVGSSPVAAKIREQILEAARNDARENTVLITGETGTGKEVIAQAIHQLSSRKNDPMVSINCGSIALTTLISSLFGVDRGAFTDAVSNMGAWKRAGSGHFFMDEVGDLPSEGQVAVLRALEEGKIQRVGGTGCDIEVHARVIAATKQDIYRMIGRREFRDDLYYRLAAGHEIRTPALRDHPESIPSIANHLWKRITKQDDAALPVDIATELTYFSWPGNVRDLRNVLNKLHSRHGGDKNKKDLSLNEFRVLLAEIPGMARNRRVVIAPKGQLSQPGQQKVGDLMALADKIVQLKVSSVSRLEKMVVPSGIPCEIADDLNDIVHKIDSLLAGGEFQLPESVAAITDLKGRCALALRMRFSAEAGADSTWKAVLESKLVEVESVLDKERELMTQAVLSPPVTDQVQLSDDLLMLTEALAAHTHEIWRRERELNGWKYGEKRDDVLKTNPDLMDYEKLPEKEKDLSRKQALGTIKAIVALGYSIERPEDGDGQ